MRRGAFTLVEVIAALALFGIVAVVIGQASFNALNSVAMLKKDSMADAYTDFMRAQVLKITDLKELRSGVYVQDPEGERVRLEGDAELTGILDLFRLKVFSRETGYEDVFYLYRREWYDQLLGSVSRDDFIRDRKTYLEDFRRESFKNGGDE